MEIATLMLIVLVGVLPFIVSVAADPDLWWQIRSGELILDQGSVPQTDTWSFNTEGEQWTNHEWLSGVVFAKAYEWGGSIGLLLVRNALFLAMVGGLVIAYARRIKQPLIVFFLVLVTVPILAVFINVRAHSFTYVFVVWSIVALDRARDGNWKWLYLLPVISLLWANLHGGFALGLGLIGLSLLFMLLGLDGIGERPSGRDRMRIIWVGLATLATTLINPFGPLLYVYVFEELGAEHVLVSEWQPITGGQIQFFWIYLLVPVVMWLLARRWRSASLLVMLILTTILTWQAARFFVLMGIFGSIVAAGAIGVLMQRFGGRRLVRRYAVLNDPKVGLSALAVVAVIFALPFVADVADGKADVTVDTSLYPVAAAEWMDEQNLSGNLAVPLPYGGYAIWNFAPELKVAVDGRNITLYDEDWIDEYLLALDEGRALSVVDESSIDVWLLRIDEEREQIAALERTLRWNVAYRDDVAVVMLRGEYETVDREQPPRATFPASVRR